MKNICMLLCGGRVLETRPIGEGAVQTVIPLAKCRSGLYVVQIMDDVRPLFQQKLHVSH